MVLTDCDILVVGGGINGCGIARDAAGRGYSVILAEKSDLAGGASSASTKLVDGGVRHLEQREIRLLREALTEREILWRMAPHIVRPLRFVLPHSGRRRPAWRMRLGLFVYDHMGTRKLLPPTRRINLRKDEAGWPLKPTFTRAFEYSDAWAEDSRLVVLNAVDAYNRGARILTRTAVTQIERRDGVFHVQLRDVRTGALSWKVARLVVNAAGPWVDRLRRAMNKGAAVARARLLQGSHIVVPKLFGHDRSYILRHTDNSLVFAVPFERDFTLIGATDRQLCSDPDHVSISTEEIAFLCEAATAYFRQPVLPSDVVWSYTGVRSLYGKNVSDTQKAPHDYVLEAEEGADGDVAIHVYGGKITTYRRLAEAVMRLVEKALDKRGPAWTADSRLPGGDLQIGGLDDLLARLRKSAPDVPVATLERLMMNYGTFALAILRDGSLGSMIGADLGENELRHLVEMEWAMTPEDVLWRRTKLGLRFSAVETRKLAGRIGEMTGNEAVLEQ